VPEHQLDLVEIPTLTPEAKGRRVPPVMPVHAEGFEGG
jgi:hypothetical protein